MSNFKSDFEVIRTLGEPALLEQLAEECSELAQAALKLARKERGENPTPKTEEECVKDLLEELGDVNLCMSVIEANRGIHIRCLSVDKKERWAQRIREARGEVKKETPGEKKENPPERVFENVSEFKSERRRGGHLPPNFGQKRKMFQGEL